MAKELPATPTTWTLDAPLSVEHRNIGQKYRIVIERAASTKGVDGFKVEANGDDIDQLEDDIQKLARFAHLFSQPNIPIGGQVG